MDSRSLGSFLAVAMPVVAACAPAPATSPAREAPVVTRTQLRTPESSASSPPAPSSDASAPASIVDAAPDGGATVDKCRGASFDLNHLPDRCPVRGRAAAARADDFSVDVKPATSTIRGGDSVEIDVTFTNTSGHDIEIEPGCFGGQYDVYAFSGRKRVNDIGECFGKGGGGCGGAGVRAIVVEPKGVLRTRVTFVATRQIAKKPLCFKDERPLPPGRYDLVVEGEAPELPFVSKLGKVRRTITVVP